MAINLQVNTIEALAEKKSGDIHLHFMPAKITTDCTEPLNVANHFNNYTVEENDVLLNSLRGFPLKGNVGHVPEHYKGVVFKETQKPLSDTTDRSFKVEHVFDEFTYWNYDKVPSQNDALPKVLDWIKVANVVRYRRCRGFLKRYKLNILQLHEPVQPEDMVEAVEMKSKETTAES